jgi:hypothetical protein
MGGRRRGACVDLQRAGGGTLPRVQTLPGNRSSRKQPEPGMASTIEVTPGGQAGTEVCEDGADLA